MLKYIVKSMRLEQLMKNFFVFAGLVFSLSASNLTLFYKSTLAFIIFCLISSAVYIFNDIVDIKADRRHPDKAIRPIAAGKLPINIALAVGIGLSACSFIGGFYLNLYFGIIILSYFILNVAYSLALKRIAIIDIFTISFGFVLRVVGGIVVIGQLLAPWILFCTLFLALLISLGKRRAEIMLLKDSADEHRPALQQYPLQFLDYLILLVATSTVMAYSLFTFTSGKTQLLMLTIPFVLYGVFRYLYLIYVIHEGGAPTELIIKDKPLFVNCLIWIFVCILILYFKKSSR